MSRRPSLSLSTACVLLLVAAGCSGGSGNNDAGSVDSGHDAGVDAGVDAGHDGGIDAGTDAGMDAGHDAGMDAGTDAGMADAGMTDGGIDASIPDSGDVFFDGGQFDGDAPCPSCDGGAPVTDGGIVDGSFGNPMDGSVLTDAGIFDGGTFDGGMFNPDASVFDGGSFDGGPVDSGPEVGGGCNSSSDCLYAGNTDPDAGAANPPDAVPLCLESTGGYCSIACDTSLGCGPNGTCVTGYLPVATSGTVPQNTCMINCASSNDCRTGYVCMQTIPGGTSGVCTPACANANDCQPGMACNSGLCQSSVGGACAAAANCTGSNAICSGSKGGYCTYQCSTDTDCGMNNFCVKGFLSGGPDAGSASGCMRGCSTNSDCMRPGYICVPNVPGTAPGTSVCLAGCTSDSDCFGGTTCNMTTGLCGMPMDGGMQMTGAGCPPGGTGCNTLMQSSAATMVSPNYATGTPPTATGGTITPGTYVLHDYTIYGSSTTGPVVKQESTIQITATGSGWTLDEIVDQTGCSQTTSESSLAQNGSNQITLTPTCPACTGSQCMQSTSYTATANTLMVYLMTPMGMRTETFMLVQ